MTDYKLVPVEPTPRLLPCPFCGGYDIGNRYVETYSCDSSYDIFGCGDCGANFSNDDQTGPALWNQRVAAPDVQGEPVAVLYADGTVLTKAECGDSFAVCCKVQTPLYAAPQPAEQHPAPDVAALVEALELISDTDPNEGTAWFHEIAYKALAAHRKQGGGHV